MVEILIELTPRDRQAQEYEVAFCFTWVFTIAGLTVEGFIRLGFV